MTPTSAGTATPRSSTATRMWPSWRRYAAGRWSCTTSIPGIAARPPWSRSENCGTTTTWWCSIRVIAEVQLFLSRVASGHAPKKARSGAPRGCRARSPVPGDQRAQRLRGATAHRGHRRRARRSGVHQRGPDPQQRLQLVAHVCGRDHRQDRHRGASLHVGQPRGPVVAGRPVGDGARPGGSRGDRRGLRLHLHQLPADPVGRDLAFRAS